MALRPILWQRRQTARGLGRLAHYRVLRHRPAINAAIEFIGSANAERSTEPSEVGEAAAASSPVDQVPPRY
jgi:hypothetical protein